MIRNCNELRQSQMSDLYRRDKVTTTMSNKGGTIRTKESLNVAIFLGGLMLPALSLETR
jgi:hypothetical protein